ncbi:MAG: PriCT-2 domain-containing protein, partial [Ignavibacterium sp.]|nr:PriCT-2 domain-containing protein [Ignavibacterium sp.]
MSLFKEIAKTYKQKMNINVLPLKGKRPMIIWDKWQTEIQTEEDINNMEWNNSTGLGGIQGINDWRCIDLDGVEDYEIVELILKDLELPEKYCWVIQSGSGEGFHIYIRSLYPSPHPGPLPKGEGVNPDLNNLKEQKENLFEKIGGEKAVYKFKMKPVSPSESRSRENGYCKHIELRWMNCQTALPPSMHESGGIYNFYFDEPKEPPVYVELEKLICCFEKYCIVESQRAEGRGQKVQLQEQVQENRKNGEKVFYDKARLESALDFLSQNLPDGSYEEWYKIGFALVPLEKEGEKYFIEMSLKNPKYKDSEFELKKKFDSLIKDYDGRVTIGTIYHIAEMYGWKKPVIKFWYRENDRIKISRIRFKKFLESEGFCKYKIESSHIFVRIENNIVEEIVDVDVKEFVMNFIERMATEEFEGTNRNEIIDALIKSANQLFTQQFLEFLITRNIEFNKDSFDKGYFYFKNGFVEVSPHPSPLPKGEGEN